MDLHSFTAQPCRGFGKFVRRHSGRHIFSSFSELLFRKINSVNPQKNMGKEKEFHELLRELIIELRLLDSEFAEACGIKKATFSSYVNGKSVPNWATIRKIILQYKVNPNWLFGFGGPMFLGETAPAEPAKQDDPSKKQTDLEQEMETFTRLMRDCGAPPEEIRKGLLAKMGVPQQKNQNGYALREDEQDHCYPAVHEPGADFGKDI